MIVILCNTFVEASELIDRIESILVAREPSYSAIDWASPIEGLVPGKFAVPVKPWLKDYLSQEELLELSKMNMSELSTSSDKNTPESRNGK